MAVETIRMSDKSREMIPAGTGARVRIMFYDASRPDMRADLTDEEIEQLVSEYKMAEVETRPSRRGERRNQT